jgi:hypothetical protein
MTLLRSCQNTSARLLPLADRSLSLAFSDVSATALQPDSQQMPDFRQPVGKKP